MSSSSVTAAPFLSSGTRSVGVLHSQGGVHTTGLDGHRVSWSMSGERPLQFTANPQLLETAATPRLLQPIATPRPLHNLLQPHNIRQLQNLLQPQNLRQWPIFNQQRHTCLDSKYHLLINLVEMMSTVRETLFLSWWNSLN